MYFLSIFVNFFLNIIFNRYFFLRISLRSIGSVPWSFLRDVGILLQILHIADNS